MYDDIIAFATNSGVTQLTCEFDLDPPGTRHRRTSMRATGFAR